MLRIPTPLTDSASLIQLLTPTSSPSFFVPLFSPFLNDTQHIFQLSLGVQPRTWPCQSRRRDLENLKGEEGSENKEKREI